MPSHRELGTSVHSLKRCMDVTPIEVLFPIVCE